MYACADGLGGDAGGCELLSCEGPSRDRLRSAAAMGADVVLRLETAGREGYALVERSNLVHRTQLVTGENVPSQDGLDADERFVILEQLPLGGVHVHEEGLGAFEETLCARFDLPELLSACDSDLLLLRFPFLALPS